MKITFSVPEAKLETRHALLAVLPWLYNKEFVDQRLKEIGLRRCTAWKRCLLGCARGHGTGYTAFVRRGK